MQRNILAFLVFGTLSLVLGIVASVFLGNAIPAVVPLGVLALGWVAYKIACFLKAHTKPGELS